MIATDGTADTQNTLPAETNLSKRQFSSNVSAPKSELDLLSTAPTYLLALSTTARMLSYYDLSNLRQFSVDRMRGKCSGWFEWINRIDHFVQKNWRILYVMC